MSLEFLLYLSLSGMGLLMSVLAVGKYRDSAAAASGQYTYSEFLATLAQAVYMNASMFDAYVPAKLCEAGFPNEISPESSGYYLPVQIWLNKTGLCPPEQEEVHLGSNSSGLVIQ